MYFVAKIVILVAKRMLIMVNGLQAYYSPGAALPSNLQRLLPWFSLPVPVSVGMEDRERPSAGPTT
jgi:hypothetical protein